jgi:acyl-CoA synthetase (AMP-forming)/AMP-acid ligase II
MKNLGFDVTHSYGLTETFGPALYCRWRPEWNSLSPDEQASFKARQGLATLAVAEAAVVESGTMRRVPSDGKTIGELVLRGVALMKGYLKDEAATKAAFQGGWFHTGDLGVMHPDGYIQLKDRSKDIIISGGENISSIEVESVLYSHPQVLEAAVVAQPNDFWGETPCAFVHATSDNVSADAIIQYCRERLPRYMAPRVVVFGELPKTATGKIQKYILRERAKSLPKDPMSKL